ncbi:hypothetical protein Tco_0411543 [Tanacetum coccineum]
MCSKLCLDSYNDLKAKYDELQSEFGDQEAALTAHKIGLKKVEAQLRASHKQQTSLNEKLHFQANQIFEKDEKLKKYRRIGLKAVKDKDAFKKNWLGYSIKSNAEVLSYEEEMDRGIFAGMRETDPGYHDIPLYSRFKQVEYKGVPPSSSDGELGTVTDHSVNDDPISTQKTQSEVPTPTQTVDPSCAQHELESKNAKGLREAALKSKRVVHTNDRQATPAWNNTNRINKANQFTPRPVNVRPNLSTASNTIKTGRVNVNAGHGNVNLEVCMLMLSAASRVNTGKRYINSGCVHINTARVNRPVSNKPSPKPSQVKFNRSSTEAYGAIEVFFDSVQFWAYMNAEELLGFLLLLEKQQKKSLMPLSLKHYDHTSQKHYRSTNPVNTGGGNVNTDDEMPEIRFMINQSEGMFVEQASYDDDEDPSYTPIQTRSFLKKITVLHALVSYIQAHQRSNHKDQQHCLFACFLSQFEPRKVTEALEDGSWVEAMQEELLQFKLQQGSSCQKPSKGSGEAQEEQISPSTLEAAQILTNVASEGFKGSQAPLGSKIYKRKPKSTKTPTKILHFEEPDSAQVNTAQVNTAELNPDSTPSAQVNTGEAERVQRRKGKEPMTEEDLQAEVQASKTSKELQERLVEQEEEAAQEALATEFDYIQARLNADQILAEKLQQEEREQYSIEDRAKNKPPTISQLRNQMITYLKHVANKKHAELKSKSFEEIQVLYERYKKQDQTFVAIGTEEDERAIKKMNEKAIHKEEEKKDESVHEEVKEEEGAKKRKYAQEKQKAKRRKHASGLTREMMTEDMHTNSS